MSTVCPRRLGWGAPAPLELSMNESFADDLERLLDLDDTLALDWLVCPFRSIRPSRTKGNNEKWQNYKEKKRVV